jgi:hypothetical protein
MLTLKSSAHIRTGRNIKGLHACFPSTGLPLVQIDKGRIFFENAALSVRQMRRAWLARLWSRNLGGGNRAEGKHRSKENRR